MPSRTYQCREQHGSHIIQTLLRKHDISHNGFLPPKLPLSRLPDPLYEPWEEIVSNLPELLGEKELHRSVHRLEILSTKCLHTEDDWRRAYVVLSFLAHAYIWGGAEASEVSIHPAAANYQKRLAEQTRIQILPPAITVPYLDVSRHLKLPPVATYASLNLWNFTTSSDDFTDLDSLQALHTFSGTEDESWFFCLSAAIECKGARIIPVMLHAIEAIQYREYQTIAESLDELRACIVDLGQLLERMDERCDPMTFYNRIRPFLAGSKNAEHAGLPNGVFYDEGDGKGTWKQLRGGSNGQSSLIQFLDVVLGVEHTSYGKGTEQRGNTTQEPRSFHEEVRSYMPEPHRRFLRHVSQMSNLREFALRPATTDEQRRMQQAFQDATAKLAEFRSKHMRIVTRYIILPSRMQRKAATVSQTVAETNDSKEPVARITGTGGTDLIPFLKQTREETLVAGRLTGNFSDD